MIQTTDAKIQIMIQFLNLSKGPSYVQVNLCQKLLFLHQLTHNMTTDCSLNYHKNYKHRTWAEHVLLLFCPCSAPVLPMFSACSFHGNSMDNFLVILWVSWCKNKCFWKIFTCNGGLFLEHSWVQKCKIPIQNFQMISTLVAPSLIIF